MPNLAVISTPSKPDTEQLPVCNGHAKHAPSVSKDDHHATQACLYLIPPDIYSHVAAAGASKPKNKWIREVTLGVLAGAYIGFGFSLCMIVGGQLKSLKASDPGLFNIILGGIGFPFGLTMVVVCGASLFTSNCMYMVAAWAERKCSIWGVLKIWLVSYFTNFAGALLLGQLMKWGDVFHGREQFTLQLALYKTSHSFGVTLVKALLANWLVNLAVWQANAAQDIAGKAIAIWLPISAFVAMGLEHCVANQFLIPFSMMIWTPEYANTYDRVTVGRFLAKNLVPATLGNILGGALFVGGVYALAYGSWADKFEDRVGQWLHKAFHRHASPEAGLMQIPVRRHTVPEDQLPRSLHQNQQQQQQVEEV